MAALPTLFRCQLVLHQGDQATDRASGRVVCLQLYREDCSLRPSAIWPVGNCELLGSLMWTKTDNKKHTIRIMIITYDQIFQWSRLSFKSYIRWGHEKTNKRRWVTSTDVFADCFSVRNNAIRLNKAQNGWLATFCTKNVQFDTAQYTKVQWSEIKCGQSLDAQKNTAFFMFLWAYFA